MKESEKDVNMKTEVTLPGNEARGSFPSSSGERESTIVMQLRGSYQKRSKQERLKGLDIKKPKIAAKRNKPGSLSGMD
jgi:hypothetical protein